MQAVPALFERHWFPPWALTPMRALDDLFQSLTHAPIALRQTSHYTPHSGWVGGAISTALLPQQTGAATSGWTSTLSQDAWRDQDFFPLSAIVHFLSASDLGTTSANMAINGPFAYEETLQHGLFVAIRPYAALVFLVNQFATERRLQDPTAIIGMVIACKGDTAHDRVKAEHNAAILVESVSALLEREDRRILPRIIEAPTPA